MRSFRSRKNLKDGIMSMLHKIADEEGVYVSETYLMKVRNDILNEYDALRSERIKTGKRVAKMKRKED